MDPAFRTCKSKPKQERARCRRQQARALQTDWLKELQESGASGREAWQVQLWLGIFPVHWRQLGRPDLLRATIVTIREQLTNSYVDLLKAMLLDPALQISLNGPANRQRKPNENLARELLELFSLGIGNYGESDVLEAARALSGYRLNKEGRMVLVRRRHDPGPHTILGRTESFDAVSLATWLGQQPSTARYVLTRVWQLCIGVLPSKQRLQELAVAWSSNKLSIPWLMITLRDAPETRLTVTEGLRLHDPIELMVKSLQLLGSDHPDALEMSLRGLRAMGQAPFEPPSVKGWPVNEQWLQLRWLQARRRTLRQLLADEEVWESRNLPPLLQASLTTLPPLSLQLPVTSNRDTVGTLLADPVWQLGISPVLS